MKFSWAELTTEEETGGTEIISYNVQWDSGSNGQQWSNLVGVTSNFIGYDYKATTEVQAGVTYQLRVRARNFWGWSEFSDLLSIKASTVPD